MRKIFVLLICLFAAQTAIASRCTITPGNFFVQERVDCTYQSVHLPSSDLTYREVIWQVPQGTPPAGGWPVVLIYQGSLFPVEFSRKKNAPFGGYWEARTIKTLLDGGYAVIAPRAPADLAWHTNILAPSAIYEHSTDYTFLNYVFDAIQIGVFGPLNAQRKYAVGISSGGYNTSRMAVTWPGQFRALVVHSASYATCTGPACVVPLILPQDHPPTRFIHGFLDSIVPWWTMDNYYDRLRLYGVPTDRITIALGKHEWFPQSPGAVLEWFNAHP